MAFINDPVSDFLHKRISWVNARSHVLADNIMAADMKGAVRKDLKSFVNILNRNEKLQDFRVHSKDVITTKTEIAREMEVLELNRNTLEHDSLINVLKNFHSLLKTVLSIGHS